MSGYRAQMPIPHGYVTPKNRGLNTWQRRMRTLHERTLYADDHECWEWTGSRNKSGRGQAKDPKDNRTRTAPWLVWSVINGEPKNGAYVLHSCDNRGCVNPNHLWLGTQVDNMQDCAAKGRVHVTRHGSHRLRHHVHRIRELLAEGKSQAEIARMFGCDPGAINHIARGRSYASRAVGPGQ